MNADRTEKLTVNRNNSGTVVKCTIAEGGVTVAYAVKTYEPAVAEATRTARAGAEKMMKAATE